MRIAGQICGLALACSGTVLAMNASKTRWGAIAHHRTSRHSSVFLANTLIRRVATP
jgi:hypothetical protein